MIPLSLTEFQTLSALRTFLLSIMPSGMEVIKGLGNRVAEPTGADFIVMTPILRERLATNVDSYVDAVFTGSIAGSAMTITAVRMGALSVGSVLLGANLAVGTTVTAFGTGSGGIGTYAVSPSQTVASQTIAAGVKMALQASKVTIQLDIHGPASFDNAAIITTLFRDEFATDSFATSGFDVTPLYTSEPRQMPFLNGEQQVEERQIVDAVFQCNPIVTVPQQFADSLVVDLIDVITEYAP